MTTISARTVLRSRNAARPDKVLSTLLLRYPRWIHAEFMTHRAFSRNAASSRAIPVKKLIEDVMENPAIPLFWGKNQKGMQATEECNESVLIWEGSYKHVKRELAWLHARDCAVQMAKSFDAAGYHKQLVNRLLEPFSHITTLVSSTEWDNFLELRDHEDAEPHIRLLARAIKSCLDDKTTIQTLQPGEWHLPFVDNPLRGAEAEAAWRYKGWVKEGEDGHVYFNSSPEREAEIEKLLIKLSVARCASTSYKTVDGFDMTLPRAIELHDKLLASKPIHASPAEHVAQADGWDSDTDGGVPLGWRNPEQHRNFEGFRQYRAMIGG